MPITTQSQYTVVIHMQQWRLKGSLIIWNMATWSLLSANVESARREYMCILSCDERHCI